MRWKDDSFGGGNFVYELSKRLLSTFEVFIITPRAKNSKKEEVIGSLKIRRFNQFPIFNIELTKMGGILNNLKKNRILYLILPFFLLQQYISIARLVRSEKIEIIHAHWIIPQALLAVLYRKLSKSKIKILATIHGSDFQGFNNSLGIRIKKYVLNNIDELTVVSTSLRDAVQEFGYKKEIYVYSMGIDTEKFSPNCKNNEVKKKLQIEGEFLLFIGSCIEEKGLRYLIEAMPAITMEYSRAKLVIVGDGYLITEMVELSEKLSISDKVIFTGVLPNNVLPEYYATADVFVMPSLSEGFGLVNIEAMSCEALVVASDISVFREVINDGITGILFEPKNPTKIAETIINCLNHSNLYTKIRTNARKDVVLKYDWIIVAERYKKIIRNLA